MAAGKTIGFIIAAGSIVFGFLFILGAFSPEGTTGWLVTGSILTLIGFGIIFLISKLGSKAMQKGNEQQVALKIELPGEVNVERFKCQDCGAQLSMDNVKMVAGAPMVDCPYCGAAYQLSEEPKW